MVARFVLEVLVEHTTKKRGTIKSIGEHYDDPSMVRVEVEHPTQKSRSDAAKAKKGKKGEPPMAAPYHPRENYSMPKEMAQHMAVGDDVECSSTIRHIGKTKKLTRRGGKA